jgi:cellobiose-specific phosphotransferase system component IIC
MKNKSWFLEMITDERDRISSKRFVGLMSAIVLWVSLLISLFTKNEYKVDGLLAEIVSMLAFGSLGLSTIDKFSVKNRNKKEEDELIG